MKSLLVALVWLAYFLPLPSVKHLFPAPALYAFIALSAITVAIALGLAFRRTRLIRLTIAIGGASIIMLAALPAEFDKLVVAVEAASAVVISMYELAEPPSS